LITVADYFLNLASEKRFCVIFIDDLQWADSGSLNILEEIVRGAF
jgi:predicted ATPase